MLMPHSEVVEEQLLSDPVVGAPLLSSSYLLEFRPLASLTGLLRTSNRTIVLAKGLRGRTQGDALDL